MSQFQAESQWENEGTSSKTYSSESAMVNAPAGVRVSKRTVAIIGVCVVLVVASMLAVYTFGRPLEGVWVRQQDDNSEAAGMTVEVSKVNGVWQGEIIAMGSNGSGFEVGQIKWHNIRKVGFGQYQMSDLVGNFYTKETYYDGSVSMIEVLNGGKQLTITVYTNSLGSGKYQVWIKQE